MNRRTFLGLAALVLLVARPAVPADEIVSDQWVVMKILGKPAGYIHETTTRTTIDGRVAFLTKSENKMVMRSGDERQIQVQSSETWTSEDGLFLKTHSVDKDGDQEQRVDAERVGDEIRVRRELNGTPRESVLAIPAGTKVYDGLDGRVLTLLGLEVGKKHTITAFSDDSCELATETAVIEGRKKVESLGQTIDAFVLKMTSSDVPGVVIHTLCSPEGELLHLTAGPMEMVRATRAEALKALEAEGLGDSLTWLPLKGGIPAWVTLDAMVIEVVVTGLDEDEATLFANDEYHAVTRLKDRFRLELHALRAPEKASEKLPIVPATPELQRYGAPALLVQSDAPEIQAEAQRILEGEKDPLAAARRLCTAVCVKLKKEKAAAATASALETLRAGGGDCTEHATLFCALARAAGLPAREAYGVTLRADAAGYHAWNEVLIDGHWVAVDATIGLVGLPPAYIRFGTSDGNGASSEMAPMIRLLGRTEIEIVSATRRGTTFDPRDQAQLAAVDGGVWRDLGADYVVDLSGGWERVEGAKDTTGIFRSPERDVITVTVDEVLLHSDADWLAFERTFADGLKTVLKMESQGEVRGRRVRTYSYPLQRQGKAGRLRVTVLGPVVYYVNALVKDGATAPEDAEKVLARVTIGDPEK